MVFSGFVIGNLRAYAGGLYNRVTLEVTPSGKTSLVLQFRGDVWGGGGGGRLPNGKVGDASSPDSKLNPADSEFEPKNGTESVFQLLSLTVHHKRYFDS